MPQETLNYSQTPELPESRHNRIYNSLLLAASVLCSFGIVSLWFISQSPVIKADDGAWMFQMIIGFYVLLIMAMVTTLILRQKSPAIGRICTMALNIVLLLFFPFGTALGIYGLWKVDRRSRSAAA